MNACIIDTNIVCQKTYQKEIMDIIEMQKGKQNVQKEKYEKIDIPVLSTAQWNI